MHICFICHEYPPEHHGGIGSFTQTLARSLVTRGHDVTVVGVNQVSRATWQQDEGVSILRLPHARLKGTGFAVNGHRLRRALASIHRQRPIDLIEAQENGFALLPYKFTCPRVIRMHGGHHFFSIMLGEQPDRWKSWLEVRSVQRADFLCAVSHFVAQTTCRLLSLPAEHVEVLPNPVDRYQFRPRSRMLEQDGLIVFVGTVCEKKGVRQLIEAMPQILKAVPHARLWIVGRDSHDSATGCSFSAALRACCPPAVESRISFKGAIEHDSIPHLLAKAVVCAYPSQMEAMSIATVEAMSMAKAVVATHAGPGPELIHDGRSGLLCDPADPRSIAEQIVRLLLDPKLRRRLGDAARIRVTLDFAADVLVDRNVEFYRRCIDTFCRLVRRPEIHRLTSCHSSADE